MPAPSRTEGSLGLVPEEILSRASGFISGDNVEIKVLVAVELGKGMDVECRRFGFSCEQTQSVGQLLLKLVGEICLGTEEDDASARDWCRWFTT